MLGSSSSSSRGRCSRALQISTRLCIPPGEHANTVLAAIGEPESLQQILGSTSRLSTLETIKVPLMDQVLHHSQLRIETGGLEDHTHLQADQLRFRLQIRTENLHGSTLARKQRRQDFEKSGLATTVGSQKSEDLGSGNLKVDAPQGRLVTVA